MDKNFLVVSALFLLVLTVFAQEKDIYKICANTKFEQVCQQLERSPKFFCDKVTNNAECILDINNNLASFGVISPEEAALAAPLVRDNVQVIAEIRPADRASNKTDYDIVIITKTTSGFLSPNTVQGKKLCHPGFGRLQTSDQLLNAFTERMLSANGKDFCAGDTPSNTIVEKKIKATAELFGPSCRPGPWVRNEKMDKELKQRYPSLCSLCPNQSCTGTAFSGVSDPFRASLECLLSGGGDVAITTRDMVELYVPNVSKGNYMYYCSNDRRNPLNVPCEWSRQPWRVIVSNANDAVRSQTLLKTYFADILVAPDRTPFTTAEEANYIKKILMENGEKIDGRLNITTSPIGLESYMKQFRDIPAAASIKACGTEIRWCTTSAAEQTKCNWFAQAYSNQGIVPPLRCVQAEDQLQCLEFVRKNSADIVMAPVRYGFIGRRKNLTAIAFPETKFAEKVKTLIVVKESNLPDDSTQITRFENMKGKRGCFPEYGGISWFSWVDTGRQLGALPKDSCDYGKLASDFLSEACMPGAKDGEHEATVDTDTDRMCQLCRGKPSSITAYNCNADEENAFFNVSGALKCLDDAGDFAVIGLRNQYNNPNADKYRVLCKNNTLAFTKGLDVDEACSLSVVVDSEVVIRRGDVNHNNIRYALEQIESAFARNLNTPFEVFNSFNKTLDLLFMDSTPGLAFEDSTYEYIRNYVDLTSHFDNCLAAGKNNSNSLGKQLTPMFILSFLSFIVIVRNKCLFLNQ